MSDYRQVIVDRVRQSAPLRHIAAAGGGDAGLIDILAATAVAAGATLHVAARAPADWLRAKRAELGDRLVVHTAPERDAIGIVPVPDLCWIAADPNYHTTLSILQALEAQAARLDRPFPVTVVENTGWPYGRRDGYDDPGALPAGRVHPHEQGGLLPGQAAPAGAFGLHAGRYNAMAENEPAMGVLTAVEDFLDGRAAALRLTILPGFGGRAIISARSGDIMTPAVLAELAVATADALEAARIGQAVALHQAQAAAQRAESLAATMRQHASPSAGERHQAAAIFGYTRHQAAAPPATDRVPRTMLRAIRLARRVRHGGARPEAPQSMEAQAIARLRESPAFDAAWYVAHNQDVASAGHDPVVHYVRDGAAELRDPGPHFSTAFYLGAYPDVVASGANPLWHYLRFGAAEGRDPGPGFRTADYVAAHPELHGSGANPLEHFLSQGGAGVAVHENESGR